MTKLVLGGASPMSLRSFQLPAVNCRGRDGVAGWGWATIAGGGLVCVGAGGGDVGVDGGGERSAEGVWGVGVGW